MIAKMVQSGKEHLIYGTSTRLCPENKTNRAYCKARITGVKKASRYDKGAGSARCLRGENVGHKTAPQEYRRKA